MKKSSSSPRRVTNLVRPLIEASERVRLGLQPFERWDGHYRADDGRDYRICARADEEDVNLLLAVLTPDMPEDWFEALQRTAFALGLEWSNERQQFERIDGQGLYAFDSAKQEWIAA